MILELALLALAAVPLSIVVMVHWGFRAPRRRERGNPGEHGMAYETHTIDTVGGKHLFAWWLPTDPAAASVILLHGWGGNAELMLPLAVPFHRAGLNVLLLDARGHGNSDAAFFTSLPRFTEDLEHALAWLKARALPAQPIVLIGHSVGAGAVIYAASKRDDIDAVISVSAFAHPAWMMRRHLRQLGLPDWFSATLVRYVEWVIGARYETFAPINTLCRVPCPVLLVHGADDRAVPVTDAHSLAERCQGRDVGLLIIDEAGHDSVEVIEAHGSRLLEFLREHGIAATATADSQPAPTATGTGRV
ncbi:MAG: alpha/beta hydrolase [Gammaproteobacteria bacterium]